MNDRNIQSGMDSQAFRGDFNSVQDAGRWWMRNMGSDNAKFIYDAVVDFFDNASVFAKDEDTAFFNKKVQGGAYRDDVEVSLFDEKGKFGKNVKLEFLIGWNGKAYVTMIDSGRRFDLGVFHTIPKPISDFIKKLSSAKEARIASIATRISKKAAESTPGFENKVEDASRIPKRFGREEMIAEKVAKNAIYCKYQTYSKL